jgi:hypothetical protein
LAPFGEPIEGDLDLTQEYDNFDDKRNQGLPSDSNSLWWENSQKELENLFLTKANKTRGWYKSLQYHKNGEIDDTSKFEAFTFLQLEAEGYITGAYRPDNVNDPKEKSLDLDLRFASFNPELIKNCNPTIIDIKSLMDPSAQSPMLLGGLDQQVTNVVNSISHQRKRAQNQNETVLHVINLFRVRLIDRPLVIALLKSKAELEGLDLDCILFLNTNPDSIY